MEAQVFVIDDDQAVRDSLGLLLKSMGHKARLFESAQAFLDDLDANITGCIVLDIRMPGMSGMELQQKLKSMDIKVPIIFVTGHGDVPMAVEAMHQGASPNASDA